MYMLITTSKNQKISIFLIKSDKSTLRFPPSTKCVVDVNPLRCGGGGYAMATVYAVALSLLINITISKTKNSN